MRGQQRTQLDTCFGLMSVCAHQQCIGIFAQHGIALVFGKLFPQRQQEAYCFYVLLADGGVQRVLQQIGALQQFLRSHGNRRGGFVLPLFCLVVALAYLVLVQIRDGIDRCGNRCGVCGQGGGAEQER